MRTKNAVFEKRHDVSAVSRRKTTLVSIRSLVYGLMSFLRPLVSLGSLTLLLVCGVLLLFSLTFPRGTHFPAALVGGLALLGLVFNYAYGRLMALVEPLD